jgi:hypothetical protein
MKRVINGVTKRYVEKLSAPFDSKTMTLSDGIFLDSTLTYSGAATGTVTGLGHLNGATDVWALADGIVVKGLAVSAGSTTLPNGLTAAKIHVGLGYDAKIRTLPIAMAQDGTLRGRRVLPREPLIDLLDACGVKVGRPGQGIYFDVDRREPGDPLDTQTKIKTGVFPANFESSWKDGGQMEIISDVPLPATLRGLSIGYDNEP